MGRAETTDERQGVDDLHHGSVAVFDALWEKTRHRYVESFAAAETQAQLADLIKSEFLDQLFPKRLGMRSLECGCGSAGISLHFSRREYETFMLDASDKALKLAQHLFAEGGVQGGQRSAAPSR
jgi:ubiquinone/menaquinone biosynthesis C-methylase UbiE